MAARGPAGRGERGGERGSEEGGEGGREGGGKSSPTSTTPHHRGDLLGNVGHAHHSLLSPFGLNGPHGGQGQHGPSHGLPHVLSHGLPHEHGPRGSTESNGPHGPIDQRGPRGAAQGAAKSSKPIVFGTNNLIDPASVAVAAPASHAGPTGPATPATPDTLAIGATAAMKPRDGPDHPHNHPHPHQHDHDQQAAAAAGPAVPHRSCCDIRWLEMIHSK